MAIVSIRQSLSALDELQERFISCASLQREFFDVLRRHTLELDPAAASKLRADLRSMSFRMQDITEDWEFTQTGTDFERSWSDYHARSSQAHQKLRNELAETLRVLGETLSELDQGSPDGPEIGIERQLRALSALGEVDDLDRLRSGLRRCTAELAGCLEALRRERAVMVTQLRDEIRTLQTHLRQTEESASADYVTGLANRREMERVVGNWVESGKPFWLIYVWLKNFKHLERELPRTMSDRLVALASAEVRQRAPEGAVLARWSDDELCALIGSDKPVGLKLTRELSAHLNTHFLLSDPGANARTVTLKAQIGMVQSHSGESRERFFHRADKLIKAIQGTA